MSICELLRNLAIAAVCGFAGIAAGGPIASGAAGALPDTDAYTAILAEQGIAPICLPSSNI